MAGRAGGFRMAENAAGGWTVAALQPEAKIPDVYRVTVTGGTEPNDEARVLTLHEDTVVAWRLVPGRRLSEAEWRELLAAEAAEGAYRAALAMLAVRPRTRKEMAKALRRKGYAPEAAAACLERLVRGGFLDDAALAGRIAAYRVTGQRKGRLLVRHELLERGVAREDAEAALAGVSEEEEREAALAFARKRLPQVRAKSALERRHKLMAMLLRRGFPKSLAREAVHEAMSEASRADGEGEEPDR